MADSFNKKEREKKRQKKKRDKEFKREQKKESSSKPPEFMYVDEDGNLTTEKPDGVRRIPTNVEDIEISVGKQEKSTESKFAKTGVVKFFNTEKGYGFIEVNGNDSYFVHADSLLDEIKEGDHVTFEVGKGPKGPVANDVKLVA